MAARSRKKKEPVPAEPAAFTIGEESPVEEERPSLSDETVGGLLALRGHLEQRVPNLLWPLQKMPSLAKHLADIESAGEAVDKLEVRHAMSNSKLAELREFLLSDAYAFTYLVCRHREIVPEVHMGMCYASAGQAGKLAWLITQSGFDGYVIERFRDACVARTIDPRTIDGVYKLDIALDWQDQRWPRGWYKSSAITHGGTVIEATQDPDRTILIVCAKEEKAFEIVAQSGKTITSGIYKDIFPDRVPPAARDVSKSDILVNGRTVSSREKTIQGTSYITREIGGHYSTIRTDDLVIRDVRGGIIGGGPGGPAIRWLHGMRGMRILSQRWRRIHVGTINSAYDDDHAWLTFGKRKSRVVSIVVPAETYDGGEYPDSVFVRGKPTVPSFFDTPKIIEALEETVADESEADGVEAFRSDFWLAPKADRERIFVPEDLNDSDRIWLGPFEYPKAKLRGGEKFAHRFYVGRIARDENGQPVDKDRKPLDVKAQGWRSRVKVLSFDPWEDMDMVMTLDGTWSDGGQQWAATAAGIDCDLVAYQFETRSGDDGITGWSRALVEMNKTYEPRVIGMDKKSYADPIVQNLFNVDPEMSKLRGKLRAVDQSDTLQESRVRAGVAEPLKTYRLMLLAPSDDPQGDYGAAKTRKDMLMYRAGSEKPWPVLDSLAMVRTIARKVMSREDREKMGEAQRLAETRYKNSVSRVTGVPLVA